MVLFPVKIFWDDINNAWFSAEVFDIRFCGAGEGGYTNSHPAHHRKCNVSSRIDESADDKECWEHEHLARPHRGSQDSSDLSIVFCTTDSRVGCVLVRCHESILALALDALFTCKEMFWSFKRVCESKECTQMCRSTHYRHRCQQLAQC